MNEVVNLLQESSNSVSSRMNELYIEISDIRDMISLIENGVSSDKNKAVHDMLDIVNEKIKKIIECDVCEIIMNLDNLSCNITSLINEQSKPKRTRSSGTRSVNKKNSTKDVKAKAVTKDVSIDKNDINKNVEKDKGVKVKDTGVNLDKE